MFEDRSCRKSAIELAAASFLFVAGGVAAFFAFWHDRKIVEAEALFIGLYVIGIAIILTGMIRDRIARPARTDRAGKSLRR